MTIMTPQQFQEAGGTGDWRALNAGADAWFDTRSHLGGAVGEGERVGGIHERQIQTRREATAAFVMVIGQQCPASVCAAM